MGLLLWFVGGGEREGLIGASEALHLGAVIAGLHARLREEAADHGEDCGARLASLEFECEGGDVQSVECGKRALFRCGHGGGSFDVGCGG
jgi:hypothetical protein